MISFFRKALSSWIVLGLFGILLVSFAVTGFGTGGAGGLGQLGGNDGVIAKVGSEKLTSTMVERRLKAQFELVRGQNPTLTFADFMKQGAFDGIITEMVDRMAIRAFADTHGLVISDRLVDSELAKKSEFDDNTGKFDREIYRQSLGRLGMDERAYEDDLRSDLLYRQVAIPAGWKVTLPNQLIAPYAGLLFEKRFGQMATISTGRFAGGAAPSDAELTAFYSKNVARYTVPETRVIRYAIFDRSKVDAQSAPTEAEINKAYQDKAADYAPRETRVLTQAILQDATKAAALVAQVSGGANFAQAAKAAGSDTITLEPQEQKGFATMSSAEVAKAAFAGAKGSMIAPVKSPLGWHVIRVDSVTEIGGKSLAQVRGELVAALTKANRETKFADFINKMDEDIGDGKSFDDVAKVNGLTIETTPAVTAGGISPGGSAKPIDAALLPVLTDAFTAEPDDDAVVVAIDKGEREVLYDLISVSPATPKPLASIRDQVVADFQTDRAETAARKAAEQVVNLVNKGTPLSKALADGGFGGSTAIDGQRNRVDQDPNTPGSVKTLFQLSKGKAKLTVSDDRKSYTIVALERLEQTDTSKNTQLLDAVKSQLSNAAGQEYVQQMMAAVRAEVGVTRNKDVIARLKASLQKPAGQ